MGTFKKQNSFHESELSDLSAERQITQLDFSINIDMDYIMEREKVNNFLLSKSYDFSRNMKVNIVNEVIILNEIFDTCFKKFLNIIDAVEIFDVVTRFYDIDSGITFSRLKRDNKTIIFKSLSNRIGEDRFTKLFEKGVLDTFNIVGSSKLVFDVD